MRGDGLMADSQFSERRNVRVLPEEARLLSRGSACHRRAALEAALGRAPDEVDTLEAPGRRSGRIVGLPLVAAPFEGERYLVSMLGEEANWVRNVRAAWSPAALRHGARAGPQGRAAAEFERVAPRFPVFRILPKDAA